jgi:hypothetical protein
MGAINEMISDRVLKDPSRPLNLLRTHLASLIRAAQDRHNTDDSLPRIVPPEYSSISGDVDPPPAYSPPHFILKSSPASPSRYAVHRPSVWPESGDIEVNEIEDMDCATNSTPSSSQITRTRVYDSASPSINLRTPTSPSGRQSSRSPDGRISSVHHNGISWASSARPNTRRSPDVSLVERDIIPTTGNTSRLYYRDDISRSREETPSGTTISSRVS